MQQAFVWDQYCYHVAQLKIISTCFQGPALEWAAQHREELNARGASTTYFAPKMPKMSLIDASGDFTTKSRMVATRKSSLEMKLHRLNFVELLRNCGTSVDVIAGSLEAVRYARTHFANFVDGHEQEVVDLFAI